MKKTNIRQRIWTIYLEIIYTLLEAINASTKDSMEKLEKEITERNKGVI